MKLSLPIFLFAVCLFFTGCVAGSQNIEEISLSYGGRDYKGDGRFSETKFQKDGQAERMEKSFVHDVTITQQSHERGKISKEQFEKLVNVLTEKGFFSKEDTGISLDSSQTIKVVYSKGIKKLQTHADDDTKAMVDAIEQTAQQIEWEKVE